MGQLENETAHMKLKLYFYWTELLQNSPLFIFVFEGYFALDMKLEYDYFFSSVSCLFVPVVLMRSLVVILILLWNLCFSFWAINYLCLDVVFLQLILLEVCVRFWICLLIVSLNLGTFRHYLFRCVFLYLFSYWSDFKSTLSSVIFCSPLKPILWIFISIIQLFHSKIFIRFFYRFYSSAEMPLYLLILTIFFFSSLNLFRVAALKALTAKSNI